ncbi:hypothetical protein [Colwellia sp. PAMC 21821]|uniref:hypothetical protein n=1 Tax=Colwellia sp. PAMC 21821 TaxID=1816219 RepID=UPI0009BF06BC|nr:hypothetical protein [Colwellia sp. PAMC 21821]ARD45127.1 hypothetical protein A3Q33_12900 [Colwellia sp. PAMC 21821]
MNYSLGAIFSTIGVLAALAFSVYALYSTPKEAALDLLVKEIETETSRLVIYNGGDGVCAELNISFPENKTKGFLLFNYEASSLMNAEYDIKSRTAKHPAKYPFYWDDCDNGLCIVEGGTLSSQRIVAMQFVGNESLPVTDSCIGKSYQVTIN